jgi:MFS family permease
MAGTVLLTLISIWLVDRVGRRPLWITCLAYMCVFLVLTGILFQRNATGGAVVLVVFLCAIPHAIALGPLPWLMISEIYPTRMRAKAVSLSTTLLWVAAFTGPLAFPMLEFLSVRIFRSIAGVLALLMHLFVFFYPGMEIPTGDAGGDPWRT